MQKKIVENTKLFRAKKREKQRQSEKGTEKKWPELKSLSGTYTSHFITLHPIHFI